MKAVTDTHKPCDSLVSQCNAGLKKKKKKFRLKVVFILLPYGSIVGEWFKKEVMEDLVPVAGKQGSSFAL